MRTFWLDTWPVDSQKRLLLSLGEKELLLASCYLLLLLAKEKKEKKRKWISEYNFTTCLLGPLASESSLTVKNLSTLFQLFCFSSLDMCPGLFKSLFLWCSYKQKPFSLAFSLFLFLNKPFSLCMCMCLCVCVCVCIYTTAFIFNLTFKLYELCSAKFVLEKRKRTLYTFTSCWRNTRNSFFLCLSYFFPFSFSLCDIIFYSFCFNLLIQVEISTYSYKLLTSILTTVE